MRFTTKLEEVTALLIPASPYSRSSPGGKGYSMLALTCSLPWLVHLLCGALLSTITKTLGEGFDLRPKQIAAERLTTVGVWPRLRWASAPS
ncbi:rCG62007 [Rattus norvegicus]|uniref:RCG62007 n=1 Tax=Rattus norvegicus TaxID=10116 RepID=A6H9T7_RAT|nr:rCG62007 [Rattus norvegicus]